MPSTNTLLIVDPDPEARALCAATLDGMFSDVCGVDDGRDALVRAIDRPPALIISEIRLPFISGLDLCAVLRSDAATAAVPFAFVTAEGSEAAAAAARAAGASAVLVKPCAPDVVRAEARRLIARSGDLRRQGVAARQEAASQRARSNELLERSGRQLTKVRSHQRQMTTTPPLVPAVLRCPVCDATLRYERSHVGGVSAVHAEQWDYYACPIGCGDYQYRPRVRKLRHVS